MIDHSAEHLADSGEHRRTAKMYLQQITSSPKDNIIRLSVQLSAIRHTKESEWYDQHLKFFIHLDSGSTSRTGSECLTQGWKKPDFLNLENQV